MARIARYQPLQYRHKQSKWRLVLSVALVSGTLMLSAKDFFYFDTGQGGNGWRIGAPKTSLFDAHQSRSLIENRSLALQLVNRDRQLNGLSPLVEDPLLSQAAQLHAQDMLKRNYYAHVTPEGKTPTDRFAQLGGQGGAGENIMQMTGAIGVTLNYRLIEEFQKSWMYSPGHRANLLKPEYTRLGYGIAADPITGRVYAAQEFSLPQ